jgi:hypothetical protein
MANTQSPEKDEKIGLKCKVFIQHNTLLEQSLLVEDFMVLCRRISYKIVVDKIRGHYGGTWSLSVC